MNTVLADNTDLEIWEGWVGDTQSMAATWHRVNRKAQCGFQIFNTWQGCFTLMLLADGKWSTPVQNCTNAQKVRQTLLQYMSKRIELLNNNHEYTDRVERSFKQAHAQINQWMNDQSKVAAWMNQHR